MGMQLHFKLNDLLAAGIKVKLEATETESQDDEPSWSFIGSVGSNPNESDHFNICSHPTIRSLVGNDCWIDIGHRNAAQFDLLNLLIDARIPFNAS